jgi:hypothetical protein
MHIGPRELYRGTGGIGVQDSPSLMFTTNVDCIACHRRGEETQAALRTTKYAERAISEACVDCHGEGFDETLKQWKVILAKSENESNQKIFNVQNVLYEFEKVNGSTASFKKAQHLLNEARHNYSLVLLGKGVHNIEYAFRLLNTANHKTEQALAVIDKDYKPQEFQTQMTCTTLCHVGIEKRTVPFNDVKFSHKTHSINKELKCLSCHTPRENHGKTLMKNCAGCHHGKEIKKVNCEDCHVSVKRLIQGKGGIGVKERPSIKLDAVECIDCHRGVPAKKKDNFDALEKRCVECHDQSYGKMAAEWRTIDEEHLKNLAPKMAQVKEEIERIDRQGGHTFVYRKLYGEAEFNYNLVSNGKGVHNLEYAEALLEFANRRLDEAIKQVARRKQEVTRGKM